MVWGQVGVSEKIRSKYILFDVSDGDREIEFSIRNVNLYIVNSIAVDAGAVGCLKLIGCWAI